jgi:hypothetical protein
LLYFWINQATGGILRKKKKKLLDEVYKQLLVSTKTNLILELGKNFHLVKSNNQTFIPPKNILINTQWKKKSQQKKLKNLRKPAVG